MNIPSEDNVMHIEIEEIINYGKAFHPRERGGPALA
jgi:hypothetical protein